MGKKKAGLRKLASDMLLADVAIDETHVYAAAPYSDTPELIAVSLDGEERRDLLGEASQELSLVVAGTDHLFAASAGTKLVSVAKLDGAVTTLASDIAGVWALARGPRHLYASALGSYPSYANGGVVRVPYAGGDTEWIVRGRSVSAIAVDDDGLVVFASDHQLWVQPEGGEPRALAPARNPHVIVIAGDLIVWTEFDANGALRTVGRGGGPARTLAEQPYTSGLVAVDPWLYWSKSSTKRSAALWRMPLGGGEAEPLAKFSSKGPRVAANARVLCLVGHGDGGVHALDL